jgi:hypothetical protein
MFAMVSSNLADLMGATRPRTSQHLYETAQDGAETTDPASRESGSDIESNDAEHRINTASVSV